MAHPWMTLFLVAIFIEAVVAVIVRIINSVTTISLRNAATRGKRSE